MTNMNEKKSGFQTVLNNWKQGRLKTKFNEVKKLPIYPQWKIKFSPKFEGKLFTATSRWKMEIVNLHYYKYDMRRFGTSRNCILSGENVIATGRVGDYMIKSDRKEQNTLEVVTTKGVWFIFWPDLKELKPSIG